MKRGYYDRMSKSQPLMYKPTITGHHEEGDVPDYYLVGESKERLAVEEVRFADELIIYLKRDLVNELLSNKFSENRINAAKNLENWALGDYEFQALKRSFETDDDPKVRNVSKLIFNRLKTQSKK